MFELETRTLIAEFSCGKEVRSVAFSPCGSRLAVGSADGKARVFELETRTLLAEFSCKGTVTSVAFSPCGSRLAVGSFDG